MARISPSPDFETKWAECVKTIHAAVRATFGCQPIPHPHVTVRSVSIFTAELPFHAPFRISLSVMAGTTNLFIR
ncbi:MAG: hypothetical protein HKN29_13920, partial [Rhodothermales bacterium]|nr:hypothetical protein [Rhodothermales bacterium]